MSVFEWMVSTTVYIAWASSLCAWLDCYGVNTCQSGVSVTLRLKQVAKGPVVYHGSGQVHVWIIHHTLHVFLEHLQSMNIERYACQCSNGCR